MESPHGVDARSYEEVLGVLARVAPTMPTDARSRAAWQVARAKLDLAAAVAAEGYSLHASPVTPAPPSGRAVASAKGHEATEADFAVLQHAALGHLKKSHSEPNKVNVDAVRMLHTVVKLAGPAAGEDFIRRLNTPTPLAPRHRFDPFGPEVTSKSSNPEMQEFGRQIQWIAAHEAAGNPKFKGATEALAAYREANG
jgi:hypothetical protein